VLGTFVKNKTPPPPPPPAALLLGAPLVAPPPPPPATTKTSNNLVPDPPGAKVPGLVNFETVFPPVDFTIVVTGPIIPPFATANYLP
jgi:hypothetical protein